MLAAAGCRWCWWVGLFPPVSPVRVLGRPVVCVRVHPPCPPPRPPRSSAVVLPLASAFAVAWPPIGPLARLCTSHSSISSTAQQSEEPSSSSHTRSSSSGQHRSTCVSSPTHTATAPPPIASHTSSTASYHPPLLLLAQPGPSCYIRVESAGDLAPMLHSLVVAHSRGW